MVLILLIISNAILIMQYTCACPSGHRDEKVDPLGPCQSGEPKCPSSAYCYPLKWTGLGQFEWVCCPNITYIIPPPPTLPVKPHQPASTTFRPLALPNNLYGKRSKGTAISIPLNDDARRHMPFAIMKLVQEQIRKYPIFIIALSTCPWCRKAKEFFDDFYPTVPYYYFDYDLNPDGNPIANAAMGVSGMRTVPMVYICQQLIGGFTDLQNYHAAHELQPRMEKCMKV